MELLTQLQPWHWFVLAAVLFVVEITASTGFFIGIALAALVLSGVLLVMPEMSWGWQFGWFGLLSIVLTVAYNVLFKDVNETTDNPLLNNRAAQLIGKSLVLGDDLDGTGPQMIGDTRWTLRCDGRLAKDTRVRVVASEGMVLVVEAE